MPFEPIAIVGQSCVLPGALSPDELWEAVLSGRDLLTSVEDGYWRLDKTSILTEPQGKTQDRAWSDRGGYVRGFRARFDPTGFTLPPESLATLDPLFLWVLHGVREALQSAGMAAPQPAESTPVGLVLGNLSYPTFGQVEYAESTWFARQAELGGPSLPNPVADATDARNRFSSGLPAHLAAQALNLGGEAFSLDSACASSLYAIKLACDRLQDRRADIMVAGAVNRTDDLFIHIGFCALQAMSKRGQSRPFSADADGLVPAEGAAFVVLKRLSDAIAAGDEILGVIRGIGLSNDGTAGGFLSPSETGQVRAMRTAYAMAGFGPEEISLLECHATGTPVGDATEVRSAAQLFGAAQDLPIGSLKSNLGHLITVAGVAGLLKVLAAMRHGVRPPMRPVETPIGALDGTPFRILQAAEPWPSDGATPRRAAVSAFGFGGNNAHLVVEEWQPPAGGPVKTAPVAQAGRTAIAIVDL
ncbi:MAG: polyketide synthase, partial [Anaerolineae bacterium]